MPLSLPCRETDLRKFQLGPPRFAQRQKKLPRRGGFQGQSRQVEFITSAPKIQAHPLQYDPTYNVSGVSYSIVCVDIPRRSVTTTPSSQRAPERRVRSAEALSTERDRLLPWRSQDPLIFFLCAPRRLRQLYSDLTLPGFGFILPDSTYKT